MNLPNDILQTIKQNMKRPEGSVTFEYVSEDLTNRNVKGGTIFEITSGKHAFILERTDDMFINYYYSSPGAGTFVATIDLNPLPQFNKAFFCFTWTPSKITLSIGPREIENAELITVNGIVSKRQIRVGEDDSIYFIGDENVSVMDISIYKGGKQVLSTTAIDAWKNTKSAIEILGTGKSEKGYMHECVVTNLSLSIMVTGFESYLKKRFMELESEGIKPNNEDLIQSFLSQGEKDNNLDRILVEEANEANISILKNMVQKRRINFQSFDDFKKAYKKAYSLTLDSANIDSRLITPIKKYLSFRHRIIHVSPLLGVLNEANLSTEEPIFPKESLKIEALQKFDDFIELFHKATLKLKRKD